MVVHRYCSLAKSSSLSSLSLLLLLLLTKVCILLLANSSTSSASSLEQQHDHDHSVTATAFDDASCSKISMPLNRVQQQQQQQQQRQLHQVDLPIPISLFHYLETMGFVDIIDASFNRTNHHNNNNNNMMLFRAQGFSFHLYGVVVHHDEEEADKSSSSSSSPSSTIKRQRQRLVGIAPSTAASHDDILRRVLNDSWFVDLLSQLRNSLLGFHATDDSRNDDDDSNSSNDDDDSNDDDETSYYLVTGNNITLVSWTAAAAANDDDAAATTVMEELRDKLLFHHDADGATHYLILPLVLSSETTTTISVTTGSFHDKPTVLLLDTSHAFLIPKDGAATLSTVSPVGNDNDDNDDDDDDDQEEDIHLVVSIAIRMVPSSPLHPPAAAADTVTTTVVVVVAHDNILQDFDKEPLPDLTIAPIRWNRSGKEVGKGCHRMGLPHTLSSTILDYFNGGGIAMVKAVERYLYTDPFQRTKQSNKLLTFKNDGGQQQQDLHWYMERPSDFDTHDMILFVPATKDAHVHFLKALSAAGLNAVLDAVGKHFGWDGMVVAHLSTFASSEGNPNRLVLQSNYQYTDDKAYNLLIPLILGNATDQPELDISDPDDILVGKFKYSANEGVLMGGFCDHGKRGVNLRDWGGYQFYVGIYLTDVNEENVSWVTPGSYLDGYPFQEHELMLANAGTHWSKTDPSVTLPTTTTKQVSSGK